MSDAEETMKGPERKCQTCGAALPANAPMGLCVPCLLGVGLWREPAASEGPSTTNTEAPHQKIGPYKLLQKLGEGGMGTVWMAEQEEPIRRKVALKIIKAGMDSKQILGR